MSGTEVERGRKLENMRLGKKRRVLARLLGWQTALGQAGRLAVGKELCWLVFSGGGGGVSATPLHATQM